MVDLHIDGRIDRIEEHYRSDVLAPLSLSAAVAAPAMHPTSRGVAHSDPSPMQPGFFRAGSVQVGVQLGLMNGFTHVLWDAGLLDLDVTALLPAEVSSLVSEAHLSPRLPPILRTPRVTEEQHDLVLELGQLELPMTFQGRPARFGVRIDAGVDISLVGNTVAIDLSQTPVIHVWAIELAEDERVLTPDLVAMLLGQLWPNLRMSLASGLRFELPIPPLTALGSIAPDLATLTLSLDETDPRIFARGETLLLSAALTGRVP
jgi:hypothetical protein